MPGRARFRELYPFTPHWLPLRAGTQALRLHYVDEGPRAANRAVLMLHGNPTWSFYYRNLILRLRGSLRCVAPDHIGCGFSDKPQSYAYTLQQHIENTVALIDHLRLDNLTLVVHDWGGAIGMGAALQRPGCIGRIVVLNTAAFRSSRIPLRIAMCRIPGFGALAVRGLNGFARAALFMATERGLPAAVKDGLVAPYNSWANRIAVHRFVQDIPMNPSHPSYATLGAHRTRPAHAERQTHAHRLGHEGLVLLSRIPRAVAHVLSPRHGPRIRPSRPLCPRRRRRRTPAPHPTLHRGVTEFTTEFTENSTCSPF